MFFQCHWYVTFSAFLREEIHFARFSVLIRLNSTIQSINIENIYMCYMQRTRELERVREKESPYLLFLYSQRVFNKQIFVVISLSISHSFSLALLCTFSLRAFNLFSCLWHGLRMYIFFSVFACCCYFGMFLCACVSEWKWNHNAPDGPCQQHQQQQQKPEEKEDEERNCNTNRYRTSRPCENSIINCIYFLSL